MTHDINWVRLGEAVEFYKAHGFEYIDTPWYVDYQTVRVTCPVASKIMVVDNNTEEYYNNVKALVGSAEQGFMQMALDGKLPNVNYVSCGPCFRDDVVDKLHQKTFMKVELFSRCNSKSEAKMAAKELRNRAKSFMNHEPTVVKNKHGWDLELNGIEVGSYGGHYYEGIGWWAYGTGLAEPRYTLALEKE
jgi:hypothetical protein